MKTKLVLFPILFLFVASSFGQNTELGTGGFQTGRYGGFFDYSDPTTLNIKVAVWGYVKYPGRYLVPIYTTVSDILSFAGGPEDGAHLDDVRLYRPEGDNAEEMINLDYSDLVYEENLKKNRLNPNLKAGDTLILPGSPRYYFREWLGISLSILSAVVSLTILILNINRN
jgi:hypothetical protein